MKKRGDQLQLPFTLEQAIPERSSGSESRVICFQTAKSKAIAGSSKRKEDEVVSRIITASKRLNW